MNTPREPLAKGKLGVKEWGRLGLSAAQEVGWLIPVWTTNTGLGILGVQDVMPPSWLSQTRKVTGLAGTAFNTWSFLQEAGGVGNEWKRLRRRARIGQAKGTGIGRVATAVLATTARAVDVIQPLTRFLDIAANGPLGAISTSISASIRIIRCATNLAQASRLSALTAVVKAKKSHQPLEPRLVVLDRLAGAVRSTVEQVIAGLEKKISPGMQPEEKMNLVNDAREEIKNLLQDRIGEVGAQKLLEVASTWSQIAHGECISVEQVNVDPLESLRSTFDGLESLRLLLATPSPDLAQIRESATNLADALVHSLREDARLIKTQAIVQLLLSIISLLIALASFAALAFPPGAAIILIIQSTLGIAISITNLAMLRLDALVLQRRDLAPLRERLTALADVASSLPNRSPKKKKKSLAVPPNSPPSFHAKARRRRKV